MRDQERAELEARHREAMERARAAPLNPYRLDADGHRWIEPMSDAWARHSREARAIREEIDRLDRGEVSHA